MASPKPTDKTPATSTEDMITYREKPKPVPIAPPRPPRPDNQQIAPTSNSAVVGDNRSDVATRADIGGEQAGEDKKKNKVEQKENDHDEENPSEGEEPSGKKR